MSRTTSSLKILEEHLQALADGREPRVATEHVINLPWMTTEQGKVLERLLRSKDVRVLTKLPPPELQKGGARFDVRNNYLVLEAFFDSKSVDCLGHFAISHHPDFPSEKPRLRRCNLGRRLFRPAARRPSPVFGVMPLCQTIASKPDHRYRILAGCAYASL
jgi:hypothetical protein